jgi:uncharacterized protein (DUF1697 family)
VNVGGNNKLPMPGLREALTAAGFESVQTLLNSGNVILAGSGPSAALAKKAAALIKAEFGLTIAVMVRDHQQLAGVMARNPYPDHVDQGKQLMCGFFDGTPKRADLDGNKYHPDEFRIDGDELFLWYPEGLGRSKLSLPAIEKAVGTAVTVRNWNTVVKLAALTAP